MRETNNNVVFDSVDFVEFDFSLRKNNMAELELATASSATSMEHPSTAAHLALNDRINHPEDHSKEQYGHSFILTDNDRRRETSCIAKMSKKRLATPIETPAVCKKIRIPAVQRTHSPRTQESSQTVVTDRCPQLQKVTPTLKGIKEVCRHLLTRNTGEKAHLVAIPTECTYEICSAISWSKRESLSEEEVALRNHQLDQCKSCKMVNIVKLLLFELGFVLSIADFWCLCCYPIFQFNLMVPQWYRLRPGLQFTYT